MQRRTTSPSAVSIILSRILFAEAGEVVRQRRESRTCQTYDITYPGLRRCGEKEGG